MKVCARKKLPTAKWRTLAETSTPVQVFKLRDRPKTYCLRFDSAEETIDLQLSERELWSLVEKASLKAMITSGPNFRQQA